MKFAATVLACYFISIPGMYLLLRARLGASVVELASTGFFFGLGLSVIFYLALGRYVPMAWLDGMALGLSAVALALVIIELRARPLPLWTGLNDPLQIIAAALAILFMLIFTFSFLTLLIDDDLFIHLPNIKRIAMGDVPPHFPFFPSSLLRGHVGRDVFTGTIARYMDLRPEIAILYVTLAACPAYVLTAHSLAWRLAKGASFPTCFCLFGLLFLVSFAIGPYEIRAGVITYVLNNNAFAFGYAFFFGWLIERVVSTFPQSQWRQAAGIRRATVLIGLFALAHTAQYFVYISNFLIFSIFVAALPLFLAVMATHDRVRVMVEAAAVVALAGLSVGLLQLLVSPLFLERILVSIGMATPDAPMGIVQQAHLTFPKPLPFTITSPGGDDVPFLTWRSLSGQGLSFYVGLAGLFIGLRMRHVGLAGASLLGWLTMLWLLLVDMGEYRAEPLRLFLLAHIGFGASVGLIIGLAVQKAFSVMAAGDAVPDHGTAILRLRKWAEGLDRVVARHLGFAAGRAIRSGPALVLVGAVALCGWMARPSLSKFIAVNPLRLKSVSRMAALLDDKDPETLYLLIGAASGRLLTPDASRTSLVNLDAFRLLEQQIKRPSERLLVRVPPDQRLKGSALGDVEPMITAASITGAGIVGMSQEHGPPHMSVAIFPYNYTANLFWQNPTVELLMQLSPNWILVDPSQVSKANLEQIKAMPGISQVWTLDDSGEQRILLKYAAQPPLPSAGAPGVRLQIEPESVRTAPLALVEVIATVASGVADGTLKAVLSVADENDHIANVMDTPVVNAVRIDDRHYRLKFSMIQPGRWHVYFIDPASGTRLNDKPLLVDVGE